MDQVRLTRLLPYRPSRAFEDHAFNSGVVKGEQNIMNFLMGLNDE